MLFVAMQNEWESILMHNVQESDWADDIWCSHTGMDSGSDYCYATEKKETAEKPMTLEEMLRKKIEEEDQAAAEKNEG